MDYSKAIYDKIHELQLFNVARKFCIRFDITKNSFPFDTLSTFMGLPFETVLGYYLIFISEHGIEHKYSNSTYELIIQGRCIKKEQIDNIYDMYYKHIVYSFHILNKQ